MKTFCLLAILLGSTLSCAQIAVIETVAVASEVIVGASENDVIRAYAFPVAGATQEFSLYPVLGGDLEWRGLARLEVPEADELPIVIGIRADSYKDLAGNSGAAVSTIVFVDSKPPSVSLEATARLEVGGG